jgi:hypothetical protein
MTLYPLTGQKMDEITVTLALRRAGENDETTQTDQYQVN